MIMEHAIFETLVDIINNHSTWVTAELSPEYRPYMTFVDGQLRLYYSPSVILTVFRHHNGYKEGHKWIYTENQLEDMAKQIRMSDEGFWTRLTDRTLTLEDVEMWIIKTSYGFVSLELDRYPFFNI